MLAVIDEGENDNAGWRGPVSDARVRPIRRGNGDGRHQGARQDQRQKARVSPRDQLTPSVQLDVERLTDSIAEDNLEAALRVREAGKD